MKKIVKETKSELKKVIWPSANDVVKGTLAVIVISGIVGLFIILADFGSLKIVETVTTGISGLIS